MLEPVPSSLMKYSHRFSITGMTFGARPFFENLRRDGVHFNHQTQEHIQKKLRNAINEAYVNWPVRLWGYSDRNEEENQ